MKEIESFPAEPQTPKQITTVTGEHRRPNNEYGSLTEREREREDTQRQRKSDTIESEKKMEGIFKGERKR